MIYIVNHKPYCDYDNLRLCLYIYYDLYGVVNVMGEVNNPLGFNKFPLSTTIL